MADIAKQCWVSGRVQGVFFRASTQEKAKELGLRGRAENLPDGRVWVVVAGPIANVSTLIEWLHEGPLMARVDEVVVEAYHQEVAPGFGTA